MIMSTWAGAPQKIDFPCKRAGFFAIQTTITSVTKI